MFSFFGAPKDAAKRIIKYWKNRVEIFEEKAFMPLTLDKALKGDEKSLEISVLRDTHCKDDGGRAILFFDPGRLPKNRGEYDKKSMVRAFWYTLHAVLEDEEVQRKGCVIIGHPKHAPSKPDFELEKKQVGALRGSIPIRIGAIHICHPPWFFELVWPVFKLMIGSVLRKRVNIHSAKDEKILGNLESKFGIPKEKIPTDMSGGALQLDHMAWLEERRKAGL